MLDLDFVRAQFPALATPWALMDNAGGSAPCRQVIDRVRQHMERLPVQLGASYPLSVEARSAVEAGRAAAAQLLGASAREVVLGASSTTLAQQLASALRKGWAEGDEVLVTNLDHEANIGPWRKLEETGIVVREWRVRPDGELALEDLDSLLCERTRLVAVAHVSNVVGSIVDVAEVARRAHAVGALCCADGVAFAPHRRVDVAALGVDFYLVSLYKVFGPHMGVLFGREELLLQLASSNHFFVGADALPVKHEPGNPSYELAASLAGILEYLRAVGEHHGLADSSDLGAAFDLLARHEEQLVRPLLAFLQEHSRTQLVGRAAADRHLRVPTVSFTVEGMSSGALPPLLEERQLAVRFGHFYAYRLVRDLGLLEREGVVRVSLAHYNSPEEVERLVEALGALL